MRVLVTGAGGQLGAALRRTTPAHVNAAYFTRAELDVTDPAAVRSRLARERPDWVVNGAAYTAVDRAESEQEAAFSCNAGAVQLLAEALAACGGRLLQLSTDFVFAGTQGRAYRPEDPVAPLNVYGASKAAGEAAARALLPERHLVLRTAWVYDGHRRNFLTTMLGLMRKADEVRVVDDQIGTPTSAAGLAGAVWSALEHGLVGTHHWTEAGVASWYDFACAIRECARTAGLLQRDVCVRPIGTAEYPTPARRPPFAVLDKSATWTALGVVPPHWREALQAVLKRLGT